MILQEVMENLAGYIREVVKGYDQQQKTKRFPIVVYAGYPPVKTSSDETASFIYCLVTEFHDDEDKLGTAEVEIGFSICDEDPQEGSRSLINLMEHVRQALLRKRTLGGRNRLVLPLSGSLVNPQPYPQWQGRINAAYTIAQPEEEGLDF